MEGVQKNGIPRSRPTGLNEIFNNGNLGMMGLEGFSGANQGIFGFHGSNVGSIHTANLGLGGSGNRVEGNKGWKGSGGLSGNQ